MMLLRPQGLFGIHEIWDLLAAAGCGRRARQRRGEHDAMPSNESPPSPQLQPPAPLLDVDGIGISFGGLKAVQNFSIRLPRGGTVRADRSERRRQDDRLQPAHRRLSNRWAGGSRSIRKNLVGLKPHASRGGRDCPHVSEHSPVSRAERARQRAPRRPAASARHGLVDTLLRIAAAIAREEAEIRRKAFELLALFGLQDRADEPADCLSYGHQRHLEIVRALAAEPKVLLLDEPAAGLNSQEKRRAGQVDSRRFAIGSAWRSC